MRRAWPALLLALMFVVALALRGPAPARPTRVPRASAPGHPPAVVLVDPAPAVPEPEIREEEYRPRMLAWLPSRQNEDGSWGDGTASLEGVLVGRTGLTGLVLISFLGAGYSHLSKDEVDGITMGTRVRQGLRALLNDQREDGLFRSSRSGLDHALAALALSKAYGVDGSPAFKEPAQRAIDALVRAQIQDGSWGDGPTTLWAADVLESAEIVDLAAPSAARDRLRAYYDQRGLSDARDLLARKEPHVAPWMLATPEPDWPLHEIYARSRVVFQFDGPDGRLWKRWNEPFKTAVLRRPVPHGMNDRVVHESLTALCFQIYYRYPTVGAR